MSPAATAISRQSRSTRAKWFDVSQGIASSQVQEVRSACPLVVFMRQRLQGRPRSRRGWCRTNPRSRTARLTMPSGVVNKILTIRGVAIDQFGEARGCPKHNPPYRPLYGLGGAEGAASWVCRHTEFGGGEV